MRPAYLFILFIIQPLLISCGGGSDDSAQDVVTLQDPVIDTGEDQTTTSDTTAPTVSITNPASGTTYTSAQTVTLNASASDNVGVTQVRFYDGSTWMGDPIRNGLTVVPLRDKDSYVKTAAG